MPRDGVLSLTDVRLDDFDKDLNMIEDKLLIRKLKRGRQDALCRIYEKYRDDLLGIAAGLLSEKSDAEDVVHEVFVNFTKNIPRFTLTGSLKGYLTTCTVNKIRNIRRHKARHGTIGLDEIDPPPSDLKRPDEWIEIDEAFMQFCQAMSQLPYEQREVITLRVQADMKFSTIAAMQETSVKTVMSRYRYGISKLRTLLNGEVTQ